MKKYLVGSVLGAFTVFVVLVASGVRAQLRNQPSMSEE